MLHDVYTQTDRWDCGRALWKTQYYLYWLATFSLRRKLRMSSADKLQPPTSFSVLVPQSRETILGSQVLQCFLNTPDNPLYRTNKPHAGEVTLELAVFTLMCELKVTVKLWSAISHASFPAMGLSGLQGDFGVGKLNSLPRKSEQWPQSRFTAHVFQPLGGNRGIQTTDLPLKQLGTMSSGKVCWRGLDLFWSKDSKMQTR